MTIRLSCEWFHIMDFSIRFLSNSEIPKYDIRSRLEDIIDKTKPDWDVDRLLELIESRELFLGAILKNGKMQGIVVLQFIVDPSSLQRGIFIWAMQADSFKNLLAFVSRSLYELAEGADCTFIRFISPRTGWKQKNKLFPGWNEKGSNLGD